MATEYVTQRDLDAFKGEMRGEFAVLRGEFAELRGQFGELRGEFGELRGEFGELRGEFGELRGELREVRGELREFKGDVDRRFGAVWAELSGIRSDMRHLPTTRAMVAANVGSMIGVAALVIASGRFV